MRKTISIITIALSLSTGLLWNCGDKGNEPDLTPVKYNIYAAGAGPDLSREVVYVYDADSLTLLDSIPLPDNLLSLSGEISPDGRSLYLACHKKVAPGGNYLVKIDAQAGTLEWSRDLSSSNLYVVDDGRTLVHGKYLLDEATGAETGELDYIERNSWALHWGPYGGREVAATVIDTVSERGVEIIAVNVVTGESRGSFLPRRTTDERAITPHRARLHPDGRRVLVIGTRYDFIDTWLLIGDLVTGELLFSHQLSTPRCEISISPDGTLAAVADESDWFFGRGAPGVYVFDLVNYRLVKKFARELVYWPGQVKFLPDGERIAVHPSTWLSTGWLQVLDVITQGPPIAVDTPFFEPLAGVLLVGPRPAE